MQSNTCVKIGRRSLSNIVVHFFVTFTISVFIILNLVVVLTSYNTRIFFYLHRVEYHNFKG